MRVSPIGVCLTWLTIFFVSSVNAQNTVPADTPESSTGRTLTPETKGQKQPQGWTGPIGTGQGGAPASSPQGETPSGMQSAPEGSLKTTTEPDRELGTTGQREIDTNATRLRTRDDVIREILNNHSSDKNSPPVPPR
jgi:hypothetical protein